MPAVSERFDWQGLRSQRMAEPCVADAARAARPGDLGMTASCCGAAHRGRARTLGEDLVLIGTTRGTATVPDLDLAADPDRRYFAPAGQPTPPPAHSIDEIMNSVDSPVHLVDLRHTPAPTLAEATTMQAQTILIDLDPRQAFDAIIHVRDITPAHGAADRCRPGA